MFKSDSLLFEIHVWVVHRDGALWTEQDAENALDAIEGQIVRTLRTPLTNGGAMTELRFDGRASATMEVLPDGAWLHEVIPVRARVTQDTNRRTVREAIANFLQGGVPAAQRVFSYQPAFFGTGIAERELEMPVVYVVGAGSER